MFDKILFDRNAFDRSVSSEGITLTMLGSAQIGLRLTVRTPNGSSLSSIGSLVSNIQMQQAIVKNLTGNGNLNDLVMIFKRSTAAPLSGQGALVSNFTVRTPITAALRGNGGVTINSQMFMYQRMQGALSGTGVFTPKPVLGTAIIGEMHGTGGLSPQVRLSLPLDILQEGQGGFVLRRLGALNENVIELININLLPGETITIDTDLMQVLFGAIEDVSSITTDSIFFELNPGENEIVIDADSDTTMEVVALWQNRWL